MTNLYRLFLLKNMYIIYFNIYFIRIIQSSSDGHYNTTQFSAGIQCVCLCVRVCVVYFNRYYITWLLYIIFSTILLYETLSELMMIHSGKCLTAYIAKAQKIIYPVLIHHNIYIIHPLILRTYTDALILFRIFYFTETLCGPHEKRLLNDLLDPYNTLERPVANESEPLQLSFGLMLMQIIDVVSYIV